MKNNEFEKLVKEYIEKYGIIPEHRKTFKPVSFHLTHIYKK